MARYLSLPVCTAALLLSAFVAQRDAHAQDQTAKATDRASVRITVSVRPSARPEIDRLGKSGKSTSSARDLRFERKVYEGSRSEYLLVKPL